MGKRGVVMAIAGSKKEDERSCELIEWRNPLDIIQRAMYHIHHWHRDDWFEAHEEIFNMHQESFYSRNPDCLPAPKGNRYDGEFEKGMIDVVDGVMMRGGEK